MTRMVFSGDDILKRLLFSIVPCTGLLVIDSINLIVLSLNKALYIGIQNIIMCIFLQLRIETCIQSTFSKK